MSDHALHVVDLSVGYGTQRLVEHLDLTIAPGEIVRLAGHNGSGKSTVLRTVVGRQPALAGEVWVCGVRLEPALGAAKKDLGYAGDDGLAFPYLTVAEHLRLIARVHGRPPTSVDRLLNELDGTALPTHRDVLVRRCSRGTRRQLDLAAASLHQPRLFVLDEALDGLDEDTVTRWCERLRHACAQGAAILLTSHSPNQVEALRPDSVVHLSVTDHTQMGARS